MLTDIFWQWASRRAMFADGPTTRLGRSPSGKHGAFKPQRSLCGAWVWLWHRPV